MQDSPKSDLIDLVNHEHHHLTQLFESLHSTFEVLAGGGLDAGERSEVVETAAEDLRLAFDDMLHHFSQEEEVFFLEMERRFPELAEPIAQLVATHEFIHERTRWLQNALRFDAAKIADNVAPIKDVLQTLNETMREHTRAENEIFIAALRRMTPAERESLLRRMREVG